MDAACTAAGEVELYLDYNGSTPVHPEVLEACRPFLAGAYANPSASHPAGRFIRAAIDRARRTIAEAIGATESEIVFTSGGSESNNQAVLCGVGDPLSRGRPAHIVVCAIEHKSVLAAAAEFERRGNAVTRVHVGASGAVHMRAVESALRSDTALVSVMYSNNETGIVQPAREIAELCRARGIRFHTDAVCTLGKLPLDVRVIGCDLMSLAAHKIYAPKGSGVLYVRSGVEMGPLVFGCGQERGLRGGTENAFAVVGFARAVELMHCGQPPLAPDLEALRDLLWRGIQQRFPTAQRNGAGASLANTLNVWFPGFPAWELQQALGVRGIAVSAGASAAGSAPSHVLRAMGFDDARAAQSLRFSLGLWSTPRTVQACLSALEEIRSEGVREAVVHEPGVHEPGLVQRREPAQGGLRP